MPASFAPCVTYHETSAVKLVVEGSQSRPHAWIAAVDDEEAFRRSLAERLSEVGFASGTLVHAQSCVATLGSAVRLVALDT